MNPPEIIVTIVSLAAYGVSAVALGCQLRNRRQITALTERLDRIDDAVGQALHEINVGIRQGSGIEPGKIL